MKKEGIIISQEEFDRLTDIEKNFDKKVEENRESFKKGLEDAIKGNLVKILWTNDKRYADIMGSDLSDEGIDKFIRREDADFLDKLPSRESYDREKLIKSKAKEDNSKRIADHKAAFGLYQEIITKQKQTIRNLWWAFGIMFVALVIELIVILTH